METQITQNRKKKKKEIPKNKRGPGGIIIPDLKLYSRTIVIEAAKYQNKNSHNDQ